MRLSIIWNEHLSLTLLHRWFAGICTRVYEWSREFGWWGELEGDFKSCRGFSCCQMLGVTEGWGICMCCMCPGNEVKNNTVYWCVYLVYHMLKMCVVENGINIAIKQLKKSEVTTFFCFFYRPCATSNAYVFLKSTIIAQWCLFFCKIIPWLSTAFPKFLEFITLRIPYYWAIVIQKFKTRKLMERDCSTIVYRDLQKKRYVLAWIYHAFH